MADEANLLNDTQCFNGMRLGKMPAKNTPKQLLFANFIDPKAPPDISDFWRNRTKFPARSYGNRDEGCCTRASQAVFATRMERIEQGKTIDIPDAEVHRVYREMTDRLYGGGDTGAYEQDALDCWRREDQTFRDVKGRPYMIDGYMRVNHLDMNEVRRAIAFSGAHGVKLCFALPLAWQSRVLGVWDAPPDGKFINEWAPYSWGGHSMAALAYAMKLGISVPHTWYDGDRTVKYTQEVQWGGMAYCDEMYIVIDKVDAWREKARAAGFDLTNFVSEVNRVSSVPIERRVA